jgi:hypothetical protein
MKKSLIILLAASMLVLTACGSNSSKKASKATETEINTEDVTGEDVTNESEEEEEGTPIDFGDVSEVKVFVGGKTAEKADVTYTITNEESIETLVNSFEDWRYENSCVDKSEIQIVTMKTYVQIGDICIAYVDDANYAMIGDSFDDLKDYYYIPSEFCYTIDSYSSRISEMKNNQ